MCSSDLGGIPPKKTEKTEQKILAVANLTQENVRFLHMHRRNLTTDDLRYELSKGGPTEKLFILGCSKAVAEKITKIIGKKPIIVIANKLDELTQKKTA